MKKAQKFSSELFNPSFTSLSLGGLGVGLASTLTGAAFTSYPWAELLHS